MPKTKNQGKNKSRFEVRGGLLNEYEFALNEGAMTEEERNRLTQMEEERQLREGAPGGEVETLAPMSPQEREAARIREVIETAHEKAQRNIAKRERRAGAAGGKGAAGKGGAGRASKAGAGKKAAGKKGGKAAASRNAGKGAQKRGAAKGAKKGAAKKSAAKTGAKKSAKKSGGGRGAAGGRGGASRRGGARKGAAKKGAAKRGGRSGRA